jgi:hypothetical protein
VVHGGAGASPSPRGPLRGLPGEQPEGREDGRRHPPTRGTAGPIGTLVCGPVLFAAVGLGAGAAQLLPSLDLLAQSHRSGGYSLAEASGYAAVGLANLLGAPGPAVEVTGAFPGGVVLGLALAALLYGRGRGTWRAWVHAGLAGTALALCLGDRTPLWALAYRLIPGFATLHMPHRMLFLWSLALAVLAGAGVDALRTLRERPRPSGLSALVVASAASAGLAWLALPALPDPDSAASKGVLHLAAGLAAVALTAAGLSWMPHPRLTYAADSSTTAPAGGPPSHVGKGERGVSRIGLLACCLLPLASGPGVGGVGLLLPALVAADLLAHNLPRLHGQFYPPAHVYAPPPAVEWLQARLTAHGRAGDGPFRIASARFRADSGQDASAAAQDNRRLAYLPPNVPALYSGLEAAQGYLAIRSTAAGEVFDAINDLGQRPRILSIYDPRSRLLDLLNVRYFVADDADTFPSVVGGGRSLVATDTTAHPLVAAVREPLPARELEIYSSLGDAVDVEDGAAVAEVVLRTTDGREVGLLVRAGEHTAEWLYDAPRVAGTVRHRKAPIARSTVRADRGSAYQSHVYRARFDVTPLGDAAVQEVRLRVVHPRARWNVDRLILHTPLSARFRLAHAQGPLRIWENPAALPRAWWVGAYAVEPDRAAQLAALKDPAFDFTRHALLAHPIPHLPPQPASSLSDTERRVNGRSPAGRALGGGEAPCLLPVASCLSGPGPGGEVRTRNATANTRELEAMAPAPGLLLISESFAPGWRAWVDGRPAPVYRAGGNLQAVPVPAGAHTVRLTYLPTSVLAGAALSLATLAILGTWALWAARNRWGRASAASGTAAATG